MTRRIPFQRVVRRTTRLLIPFLSVALTCALFAGAAHAAADTAAPGKTKKAKATRAKTSARTTATPKAAAPGLAGMKIAIDPVTGRMRVPTAAENAELESSAHAVRRAEDDDPARGIRILTLPNGTRLAHLDERFMESAVVHKGTDGALRFECVHGAGPAVLAPAKTPAKTPAPAPVREVR